MRQQSPPDCRARPSWSGVTKKMGRECLVSHVVATNLGGPLGSHSLSVLYLDKENDIPAWGPCHEVRHCHTDYCIHRHGFARRVLIGPFPSDATIVAAAITCTEFCADVSMGVDLISILVARVFARTSDRMSSQPVE